ncbi:MAG: TadE/TadG family type IV pilus assembly protein [Pseudomonadota bacterium]
MTDNKRLKSRKTFFSRLRTNTRGNTLAMVAAGLVPLAGIIGSGVDLSRAYMVKTRLQQACDAGVLAGRKAMGDGAYDANAKSQTEKFFNANFPTGYLDSTSRTFTPVSPTGTSQVSASASVALPTIVMKIFGNDDIDVAVDCTAILEIANTDVTMVLDSTGSMNNNIDDGAGGTTTRIAALRTAMNSFYSIVDTAAAGTGSRIRYAMVPYTGTVNVGRQIIAADASYMVSGSHNYQSREAIWEVDGPPVSTVTNETDVDYETLTFVDGPECTGQYSQNQSVPGWWTANPSGNPSSSSSTSSNNGITTTIDEVRTYSYHSWDGSTSAPPGNAVGSSFWRDCVRRVDIERTTTSTGQSRIESNVWDASAIFLRWEHKQINHPVDAYKASIDSGPAAPVPGDQFGGTVNWAGCIEERDTVDTDTVSYNGATDSIDPTGALDLDIDGAPTSDASRWRPYWPEVSYFREPGTTLATFLTDPESENFKWNDPSGYKAQDACPAEAQQFEVMTSGEFSTFANSLVADGGTYHDVGMLWGARFSSPTGIFAANVNEAPSNGGYVSRHLIFMTDGILDIGDDYYSAYGLERHDQYVGTGDETQASANHSARFEAVCEATKAKGIRVWVIAFATGLSTEMTNCASPNSAFTSTNASQLNAAFATIAQSVSDLRLSQ